MNGFPAIGAIRSAPMRAPVCPARCLFSPRANAARWSAPLPLSRWRWRLPRPVRGHQTD